IESQPSLPHRQIDRLAALHPRLVAGSVGGQGRRHSPAHRPGGKGQGLALAENAGGAGRCAGRESCGSDAVMGRPAGGYKLPNGQPVPGVTTILSRFKESGGLLYWAWSQGRDGKELYEDRDRAAEVGTVAHALVEQHIANLTFKDTLQDFSTVPPGVKIGRAHV